MPRPPPPAPATPAICTPWCATASPSSGRGWPRRRGRMPPPSTPMPSSPTRPNGPSPSPRRCAGRSSPAPPARSTCPRPSSGWSASRFSGTAAPWRRRSMPASPASTSRTGAGARPSPPCAGPTCSPRTRRCRAPSRRRRRARSRTSISRARATRCPASRRWPCISTSRNSPPSAGAATRWCVASRTGWSGSTCSIRPPTCCNTRSTTASPDRRARPWRRSSPPSC